MRIMKKPWIRTVLALCLATAAFGSLHAEARDKTDEAIQVVTGIIDLTISKIDTITERVLKAKTASEAASLVDDFLTTVLSIKDEVGGLEQRFPAKSLDETRLKASLKNIMAATKAAGQRFGAAFMTLPADIRESSEVAEALKKLQGAL